MIEKLSAPFPFEAVNWRSQKLTKNKDKALALAYIDARDVMDRLDEVCGPANWSTYFDETPKGRVLCKLSIRINDEWITKTDGAGDTAVEGDKGGISDALKRAAVQWGIGRYLYDLASLGPIYAPCEAYNGKWTKWRPEAFPMFRNALAKIARGDLTPDTITQEQRDKLMALFDATSTNAAPYLQRASQTAGREIKDLRDLPVAEYEPLMNHLQTKKQKENA